MDGNPWAVDSFESFTFLCCPECYFKSKATKDFQEHALGEHPLSKTFFKPFSSKTDYGPLSFIKGVTITKSTDAKDVSIEETILTDPSSENSPLKNLKSVTISRTSESASILKRPFFNDSNLDDYLCDHCTDVFESEDKLDSHLKEFHPDAASKKSRIVANPDIQNTYIENRDLHNAISWENNSLVISMERLLSKVPKRSIDMVSKVPRGTKMNVSYIVRRTDFQNDPIHFPDDRKGLIAMPKNSVTISLWKIESPKKIVRMFENLVKTPDDEYQFTAADGMLHNVSGNLVVKLIGTSEDKKNNLKRYVSYFHTGIESPYYYLNQIVLVEYIDMIVKKSPNNHLTIHHKARKPPKPKEDFTKPAYPPVQPPPKIGQHSIFSSDIDAFADDDFFRDDDGDPLETNLATQDEGAEISVLLEHPPADALWWMNLGIATPLDELTDYLPQDGSSLATGLPVGKKQGKSFVIYWPDARKDPFRITDDLGPYSNQIIYENLLSISNGFEPLKTDGFMIMMNDFKFKDNVGRVHTFNDDIIGRSRGTWSGKGFRRQISYFASTNPQYAMLNQIVLIEYIDEVKTYDPDARQSKKGTTMFRDLTKTGYSPFEAIVEILKEGIHLTEKEQDTLLELAKSMNLPQSISDNTEYLWWNNEGNQTTIREICNRLPSDTNGLSPNVPPGVKSNQTFLVLRIDYIRSPCFFVDDLGPYIKGHGQRANNLGLWSISRGFKNIKEKVDAKKLSSTEPLYWDSKGVVHEFSEDMLCRSKGFVCGEGFRRQVSYFLTTNPDYEMFNKIAVIEYCDDKKKEDSNEKSDNELVKLFLNLVDEDKDPHEAIEILKEEGFVLEKRQEEKLHKVLSRKFHRGKEEEIRLDPSSDDTQLTSSEGLFWPNSCLTTSSKEFLGRVMDRYSYAKSELPKGDKIGKTFVITRDIFSKTPLDITDDQDSWSIGKSHTYDVFRITERGNYQKLASYGLKRKEPTSFLYRLDPSMPHKPLGSDMVVQFRTHRENPAGVKRYNSYFYTPGKSLAWLNKIALVEYVYLKAKL